MGDGYIVALDLATITGFAMWRPGLDKPVSGTWTIPQTGEDAGKFLFLARERFNKTFWETKIETLVYESPVLPPKTQIATLRKLYGLAAFTELLALDLKVNTVLEVSNASFRKHFSSICKSLRHRYILISLIIRNTHIMP